ncbi:unnamed protein product [Clonostachys solani]|uniref:Uncharacterized protein n=1 Tax=Clonostachys solani TaxID=160281 RepID=A0A9N9Z7L5_9HYPO|nr:unnamed protein product [Clonostachys solani]
MFECFRFFDIRDAHNGSVKDGGQEAYLFRHLLGYGLDCEEKHEKWKVEANPPWITPILASIYPFTQRRPHQGEVIATTVPVS